MNNSDQLTAIVADNVRRALEEDVGTEDLTANLVPTAASARAIVIAKEAMTMAGQLWVNEVFRQLDGDVAVQWLSNDGDPVPVDAEICIITGSARAILSGERTALNFLQSLSATATVTARYVNEVEGTKARILDTRKTIPGLRLAQKYAVRCGGGNNHRMGIFDDLLIKENHIISCGGIAAAVTTAKASHPDLPVEIEVESISELREALAAGADRLLLDNFDIEDLQRAVEVNQTEGAPPADLEASGGITIGRLRSIAETGVDYISVGALTKDINAIDLSMRFQYDD
jgi:nicotinate-nucleotide pyrophosphorylase (carboxylating)